MLAAEGRCDDLVLFAGWGSATKRLVNVVFLPRLRYFFLFNLEIFWGCGLLHLSSFSYFTLNFLLKVLFSIIIFFGLREWHRIYLIMHPNNIHVLILILSYAFIHYILFTDNVWKCFNWWLVKVFEFLRKWI